MAKLYFNYSAMNAGKSTILLQASHNYIERGMSTMLLTARLDDRAGKTGVVASRIGLSSDAELFADGDNLLTMVTSAHNANPIHAIFVDEAQFLSKEQVWHLSCIADDLGIPVMCYGLRTDFQGELFPGSSELLAIADDLREIKTICWCGKKATMVIRLDANGKPIEEGDQVEIGGNDKYVSLCRKHWSNRNLGSSS